jgi:lipoate---protein ligase
LTVPISRERGSAASFHQRSFPDSANVEIWTFAVERPALVLGSTQSELVVDAVACAAAGVEVVRRRSGGGVVLLEPGGIVWFDVIVPAARWHDAGVGDDVAASMIWLGERVARALAAVGVAGAEVHRGALACSGWCPLVCFAGVGPGEVTLGGQKLVGISQRRTRAGSRFQCAVHTGWSPERLAGLLTARPSVGELPPVAVLDPAVGGQVPDALANALAA